MFYLLLVNHQVALLKNFLQVFVILVSWVILEGVEVVFC